MEFFSEESDFMSHLFATFSSNVSTSQDSSAYWPHHDSLLLSVSDNTNAHTPIFSQQNTSTFTTSSSESYLSLSCSSGIPFNFIPAPDPNTRKHSCDEADVHTSWKKPKLSKTQKLGVDHDVARLNTSGKKRASNGSAVDSQSVYAKKRRERINERLRVLQSLVPNGTKVDISTMLEEAVEYVKFLQLQIKLLSSDDLWMYAPIAYNGLDLGLHVNLPSPT